MPRRHPSGLGAALGTGTLLATLSGILLGGCDRAQEAVDAGPEVDGGETERDDGPDPDWPPLLEHDLPSFVEMEGGGLGVPSLDGQTALMSMAEISS